jgi:two-component system, OmpR family, response regulator
LFSHDGQIVTRDDLSYAVDARPWRYGDRKFDVHVAKIRKKLLDSFGSQMSVSTVRSSGYCLSTNGADLFNES